MHNSAAKTGSLQATQFNSECYFAITNTLSAANANSLQATHFDSERWFVADNKSSVVNAHSLQLTHFQQRMLIRCRTHTSGSERWFAAHNSILATNHKFTREHTLSIANTNSLQTTQFRQRTLIRCTQLIFGSEPQIQWRTHTFGNESEIRYRTHTFSGKHWFAAKNSILAVNTDSLHTTQFWQWTTNSMENTHFR